jgi:hypothetical protein
MPVLHHALDAEFLDGDKTVTIDRPSGGLVHEIMTPIGDALVDTPNYLSGSPAFDLPLWRPGVLEGVGFALGSGQRLLLFSEEARVLHEGSVGEDGEVAQADIYAHSLLRGRQGLWLDFHSEADEPFVTRAS